MIEDFLSKVTQYMTSAPLLALLAVYVAGVLVSFTPCIYPAIPITCAYIGGGSAGNRRRIFPLTLSYVLGLSLAYAALGLAAATTGQLFGRISSHPASLIIAANICLFLGLAMLDVIQIPGFSFFKSGPRGKKGGVIGSFLIGMGSALVIGPCMAPVLGAILLFAAKKANLLYGSVLLFVFAFGMGTVLLLIGLSSGFLASLPKAGPWMRRVKQFFGWSLIIMAQYFLIEAGKRLI